MNTEELPITLREAVTYFADAGRALEFMKALRWPDGVVAMQSVRERQRVFHGAGDAVEMPRVSQSVLGEGRNDF